MTCCIKKVSTTEEKNAWGVPTAHLVTQKRQTSQISVFSDFQTKAIYTFRFPTKGSIHFWGSAYFWHGFEHFGQKHFVAFDVFMIKMLLLLGLTATNEAS